MTINKECHINFEGLPSTADIKVKNTNRN